MASTATEVGRHVVFYGVAVLILCAGVYLGVTIRSTVTCPPGDTVFSICRTGSARCLTPIPPCAPENRIPLRVVIILGGLLLAMGAARLARRRERLPRTTGCELTHNWRTLAMLALGVVTVSCTGGSGPTESSGSASSPVGVSASGGTRVPNVVGLRYDFALNRIAAADLCWRGNSDRRSTRWPIDYVVAQEPRPGAVVPRLSGVNLVFSKGPGPVVGIPPPSQLQGSLAPDCMSG